MNTDYRHDQARAIREIKDGTAYLLTSKGKLILVDADALPLLPKGYLSVDRYARITVVSKGVRSTPLVHRIVLGLEKGDKREVDHINGDRLDNRRANLRIVSHSENLLNKRKPFPSNLAGFLGVSIDRRGKTPKYYAELKFKRQRIHLGVYETPEEAHKAYMRAKEALIGEITC